MNFLPVTSAEFTTLNNTLNTAFGYPNGSGTSQYAEILTHNNGTDHLMAIEDRCQAHMTGGQIAAIISGWPAGWVGTMPTVEEVFNFTHTTSSPLNLMNFGNGTFLVEIRTNVTEVFATGSTLDIGISSDTDIFVPNTSIDLTATGILTFTLNSYQATGQQIIGTLSIIGTTGIGTITVKARKVSA